MFPKALRIARIFITNTNKTYFKCKVGLLGAMWNILRFFNIWISEGIESYVDTIILQQLLYSAMPDFS